MSSMKIISNIKMSIIKWFYIEILCLYKLNTKKIYLEWENMKFRCIIFKRFQLTGWLIFRIFPSQYFNTTLSSRINWTEIHLYTKNVYWNRGEDNMKIHVGIRCVSGGAFRSLCTWIWEDLQGGELSAFYTLITFRRFMTSMQPKY